MLKVYIQNSKAIFVLFPPYINTNPTSTTIRFYKLGYVGIVQIPLHSRFNISIMLLIIRFSSSMLKIMT